MRRTMLVVEDDDTVRDFVVQVLRADGHEVLTAATVEAARQIIFARPDADRLCLVIDVMLDGESGIELAQELLEKYPGFHVLLISGLADEIVLGRSDARVAFLAKPFDRKRLIHAVDTLCV